MPSESHANKMSARNNGAFCPTSFIVLLRRSLVFINCKSPTRNIEVAHLAHESSLSTELPARSKHEIKAPARYVNFRGTEVFHILLSCIITFT